MSRSRCIVLIGPPGAGKTTSGRALAKVMHRQFIDIDHEIEIAQGCSIPEIFAHHGESVFRDVEQQMIAKHLVDGRIVALGGGAVTTAKVRDLIAKHLVILLQVDIEQAMKRISTNSHRPLLNGNARQRWQSLVAQRKTVYNECADITVDTNARQPGEIAQLIAHLVSEGIPSENR